MRIRASTGRRAEMAAERAHQTSCPSARRGPRGLPSLRIFMVLGGMKAAFVPSPSLGPWRARRLDSANGDSLVWLASTRTCIACEVSFMVWIHSRFGG